MFVVTHKIDFMTYEMGNTHNGKNTDTETPFSSVGLVAQLCLLDDQRN